MKKINKAAHTRAIRHNWEDVMRHGPRLSYNRRSAVVAQCRKAKTMLLTGLGGMGVGTMWVEADRQAKGKPNFATENEGSTWYYKEFWGFPG